MKRAIIIFETKYGNTEKVAEAVAEGIRSVGGIECKVTKTGGIHTDDLCNYEAILFGCPNHNQGPALNMVRFIDRASIVHLEDRVGAAFDTYTGGNKGIALKKLEAKLREKMPGIDLVIDGLSCEVEGRKGPLVDGEVKRAHEFGQSVGRILVAE